jgi:nucleotide-binding universal stress UspA family protein
MYHDTILDEARHSIEELQKSFGLAAPLCVVTGDVATAVREAAERHRADLVIIGRGVMHERMGRLRTNAYAIIRQSPCPVLSL